MGRKAKYSKELKLEIMKRYIREEPATILAKEYNISTLCVKYFWKNIIKEYSLIH